MLYFRGVENYLNVMQNLPIFSQTLIIMWEASQGGLVPKCIVVLELQAFKFESTKKSVLVRKNEN